MSLTYSDASFTGTPTVKIIEYSYTDDGKDGWNYLLTAYDENGDKIIDDNEKISYDEIGNPLTYRGAAISWYGRQMKSFVKDGITSTMTYDAEIGRFINSDNVTDSGSYTIFNAFCSPIIGDYNYVQTKI